MNDHRNWKETKYTHDSGRLSAARDPLELSPASRIVAQQVADFYTREIPLHVKGRLLDLGCGKAPMLGFYRSLASMIVCADWPSSLHFNPDIDVFCDLSMPLPFRENSFDTIILSDVLEHVPDPIQLWKEMSRILSPGGRVIGNAPFLYWIHEAPYDYHRMTPFALERQIVEAGLHQTVIVRLGTALDTWTDLTSKILSHMPWLGGIAASSLLTMTRPFRGMNRLRLSASHNPMPLSIGFVAEKLGSHNPCRDTHSTEIDTLPMP